ncbi:hypothetical protein CXP39_02030 [Mesoplasma syrphidae]|uniref:Uncharacterized protein n=1 Tax=Mesoplasma syrphidae TaxID=225999 RepID=A0A2K9BV24_9MOLU|nr:hypothetical protein [Mesoplasma syrphidae]AUF83570.1 hypothetical protein CXP39_02030 [Mesoplasma syrphidae]
MNFKEFINSQIIEITAAKLFEKGLAIKRDFANAALTNTNPMLSTFIPSEVDIDLFLGEINSDLGVIRDTDELLTYLKLNSVDSSKLFSDGANFLAGIMSQGAGTNGMTKSILKLQFGSEFKIQAQQIEKIQSIIPKLGDQENLATLDLEDVNYLLSSLLTEDLEQLRVFLTNNPNDAEKVSPNFTTIQTAKGWDIKMHAAETIKEYFTEFKEPNFLGDFGNLTGGLESLKDSNFKQDVEKYVSITNTVNSLVVLVSMCKKIYEKIEEAAN